MPIERVLDQVLKIDSTTDEFDIWKSLIQPRLKDLPENVQRICAHGCTEMLNNVKDHAISPKVLVIVERSSSQIAIEIQDAGVGIFRKIQEALKLPDEHGAFLELAKGKITTDPEKHTGEGIFFTARMFDSFTILSGSMYVSFTADGEHWIIEDAHYKAEPDQGTFVIMKIDPHSNRTTKEVFDRFAPLEGGEAFGELKRTHLAVRLSQPGGEPLISRSQAKRILARLEEFDEAILDFEGVPEIGPAFADEVFRVFQTEHEKTRLIPVRANESVMRMIVRAQERS
jgi:anti-sigma regulatory factor (Ser/Thr protein kinase)